MEGRNENSSDRSLSLLTKMLNKLLKDRSLLIKILLQNIELRAEIEKVKNIKAEEKELQQRSHKKDNKKKKKKKHNSKTVEPIKEESLANGKDWVNESKPAPVTETQQHKPKRNYNLVDMGFGIIRGLVNTILFSALICGFTLFVISLLDENMYHKVTSFIQKNFHHYKIKIPKHVRNNINHFFMLLYEVLKSVLATIQVNLIYCGKSLVNFYTFLTTDPNVQIYIDTTKQYIHIGYIKTTEMLSILYTKLLEAIKSYTK